MDDLDKLTKVRFETWHTVDDDFTPEGDEDDPLALFLAGVLTLLVIIIPLALVLILASPSH